MASIDWTALIPLAAPLLLLLGAGVVILLLAPFAKKGLSFVILAVSGASLALAFVAAWQGWMGGAPLSMGLLLFDRMAYGFDFVLILAALLSIFLSKDY